MENETLLRDQDIGDRLVQNSSFALKILANLEITEKRDDGSRNQ
jgi:hypothetical protein